jgi:hypothetical protein
LPAPSTEQNDDNAMWACQSNAGTWNYETQTCEGGYQSPPPVEQQPPPTGDDVTGCRHQPGIGCGPGEIRKYDASGQGYCCPDPNFVAPEPPDEGCPEGYFWHTGFYRCEPYGSTVDPNDYVPGTSTLVNPDMPGFEHGEVETNPWGIGPAPEWDDIPAPDVYQPESTGPAAPQAPPMYQPGGYTPAPSSGGQYNVTGSVDSPFGGEFSAYEVGSSVLPPPPPESAFDVGQSAQQNNAFDVYNVGQSQGFTETGIGDVSAYDVNAQGMNYGEVQDFTDQAYAEAMRNLEPQMEAERQRLEQELINKGIDPYSDAGQKEMAALERSQNDQMSKAAYDAMAFGAQMQEQMFGQGATESQMAQDLLNSQWQMQQQGREFDTTAGMTAEQQAYAQAQADAAANQAAREFDVTAGMSAEAQQFDQMMQNYNAAQAGHEFQVTAEMQAEQQAFDQMYADWQQRQSGYEFDTTAEMTAEQQEFDQMMQQWQSANELAYNQALSQATLDSQNAQFYAQLGLDAEMAAQQMQLDRYAMEQAGYQFNEEMSMAQNMAEFEQMMALEELDYRDYLTSVDQARYQDSLALGLAGLAPAPGYTTVNAGLPQAGATNMIGNNASYNDAFF